MQCAVKEVARGMAIPRKDEMDRLVIIPPLTGPPLTGPPNHFFCCCPSASIYAQLSENIKNKS